MSVLLDWSTFLALLTIAFQYLWQYFLKSWYEDWLRKKGTNEVDIANKVNGKTKKLVRPLVMLLLMLAVVLAVVELVWM